MALPHELVLEVCKHLTKRDLKACRLVSKSWSHHASDYLFNKIYISPRKEDIEVFNLITQHAQLSHCVRHLEYDGTNFSPRYTKLSYVRRLAEQASDYSDFYRTALNSTDSQFTQFIKMCSNPCTKLAAGQHFSSHAFVLGGHQEWKDRDVYQRETVENGEFLRTLTCGLRKLDLLKSVEVCNKWHTWRLSDRRKSFSADDTILENLPGSYFYGSPFGRAWGLYHPMPHSWALRGESFRKGYEEFQIITTALSLSQRHIQLVHISPPPGSIFDSNVTEGLVNHSINAYSSLEILHLCLSEYAISTETAVSYGSLPGLQALLRSMGGLKHLTLVLPSEELEESTMFKYRQVFPTGGTQWIKLNKLCIDALAISAKDLFHLLTVKMPNLRELSLSDVKLLKGRGEGVIEFLKKSMHLLSFPVDDYWQMRYLDGRPFLDHTGDGVESSVFRAEIETYVVKGGRHPCLRPDEDASASRKYCSDLDL